MAGNLKSNLFPAWPNKRQHPNKVGFIDFPRRIFRLTGKCLKSVTVTVKCQLFCRMLIDSLHKELKYLIYMFLCWFYCTNHVGPYEKDPDVVKFAKKNDGVKNEFYHQILDLCWIFFSLTVVEKEENGVRQWDVAACVETS